MKGKDLKLNWKISQSLAMKNIVQFNKDTVYSLIRIYLTM